jgi:thiamine-phosphate pyrophosphorylase
VKSSKPLIYLITDGSLTPLNFKYKSIQLLEKLKVAVEAKVSIVQIREKQLFAGQVFELASQAVRIAKNTDTKILVNDRADLAFAAQADGVHLPANSIPTKIIRKNFGKNFIIGVSAHSLEKVQEAKREGADFATFSPIFPTASKEPYGAPQGVEKLKEVVEKVKDFSVIALGGIDADNFSETFQAGAGGIAGISLFDDSEKIAEVVKKINDWGRGKNV